MKHGHAILRRVPILGTARGRFPNVPGYWGLLHMLGDGSGTSKTKYRGRFQKYLGFQPF
ncbi:hypothetical protein Hanom_Chr08g00744401 [Helianthus anomalus]